MDILADSRIHFLLLQDCEQSLRAGPHFAHIPLYARYLIVYLNTGYLINAG